MSIRKNNMKAVILCGGKGKRLGNDHLPKSMQLIGKYNVLEHQISLLIKHGISKVILLTGFLHEKIEEHFNNGTKYGIDIEYSTDINSLGTAGALKNISNKLDSDFLLLYGDVMLDMDLTRLIKYHFIKKSFCTVTVHPNDHPNDSDLVMLDRNSKLLDIVSKPHNDNNYYKNLSCSAIYVLSNKITDYIPINKPSDLMKDILSDLIQKKNCYGYITREYIKDIGTPERLAKVNVDYKNELISYFNFKNKVKAVFIDRDGVINKYKGLIYKDDDFEILPDVATGLKILNSTKFLSIVVTNQSVIARNLCTERELENIHNKIETILGRDNAKFDAIYYCPHHPDKGYPGENVIYKKKCNCRKPNIGMIKKAQKDLNLSLEGSYMIGDSDTDIICAKKAGLFSILIENSRYVNNIIKPDFMAKNFLDSVKIILNRENLNDNFQNSVKN